MINDRDSFSESKLGRLTNYKIASKENFNFEGFEEMLPPILEQVPSYIHPETKQLNKAKFLELKKQIDAGLIPGPTLDVTGPYLEGKGTFALQMHQLADADDAGRAAARVGEQMPVVWNVL